MPLEPLVLSESSAVLKNAPLRHCGERRRIVAFPREHSTLGRWRMYVTLILLPVGLLTAAVSACLGSQTWTSHLTAGVPSTMAGLWLRSMPSSAVTTAQPSIITPQAIAVTYTHTNTPMMSLARVASTSNAGVYRRSVVVRASAQPINPSIKKDVDKVTFLAAVRRALCRTMACSRHRRARPLE